MAPRSEARRAKPSIASAGMGTLTVDTITDLYVKHHEALREVRARLLALRTERPAMRAQLDDIEAEISYLRVRDERPATVVEIGSLHGWSTCWLLHALRDNGHGELRTYDKVDNARRNVPADLAAGRWRFRCGDVRRTLPADPPRVDYLFVDAAHGAGFARWYLDVVMPMLAPGTPVSVHDVFHGRWPKPFSEGAVVLSWLSGAATPYLTASPARAPHVHRRIERVRAELGITDPVHTGRHNPMIWFHRP